jgi:uncharacterized protein YecE (DUF72 family)
LVRQVPGHFRFSFKVPDDITARTFPKLPRHGAKAGQRNEHFLNARLFRAGFLASLEPYRSQVGTIIFEFSHFHPRDFTRGREFVEALDGFLQSLPSGWQYAVEVRNRNLLCEPYFEMLAKHQVAHTFSQWTRMPPIQEQLAMPGAWTTDFCAARLLLKAGRGYEEAVASFSPYRETKEVNEEVRQAAARLVTEAPAPRTGRARESFVYVNNRLEGNALNTIIAILQKTGALPPDKRST